MHAKWADVVGQRQAGSKEAEGIIGAAGEAGAAVKGSEKQPWQPCGFVWQLFTTCTTLLVLRSKGHKPR